ncbi:MAG: phasin family protein [Pontibacterium sp.]
MDMYDLMNEVKEKMQPAVDMAEINKQTAEKLFALQSEYVTDFVNSCVSQMKALTEIKEPKDAIELQVSYFKTLESKLADVAEKELATLNEAKDQITDVVEKSFSGLSDNNYVAEMTKYVNDATETATQYMTEAAATISEATTATSASIKAAPVVAETPVAEAAVAETPVEAPVKKAVAKPATPKKAPAKTSRKATTAH